MAKLNRFYEELIDANYFEKQASENENIKQALDDTSASVLRKLAEELGALSEEKSTLAEKLAEECEEVEEEEEKEDKEGGECKAESEEEKDEDAEKEEEKEAEPEEEKEEEAEKEEEKEAEPEEEKEEEAEKEEIEDKEAFERDAYFVAQEKLASSNMNVADFIFEKCANEHVANYIAQTSEKLASLCDKSSLQIADEILDSVMTKLN